MATYADNQIVTIGDIFDLCAFNVRGVISDTDKCGDWTGLQPNTQMFTKTFNDNNKYKYYYNLLPQSSRDSSSSYEQTLKLRAGWSVLNDATNKLVRYKDLYLTMNIIFTIYINSLGVSVGWRLSNYSKVFTKNMQGQLNYRIVLQDTTTNTKYYSTNSHYVNVNSFYDSSGDIISVKADQTVSSSWFKEFLNVDTSHNFTAWVVVDSNTTGSSGQVKLNPLCQVINKVKNTDSIGGADTSGNGTDYSSGADTYYLPNGNETTDEQEMYDEWLREFDQNSIYG